MEKEDLERFGGAYGTAFKFHDENLLMLSWCAERLVATLERTKARSLVSLGLGHRVVSLSVIRALEAQLDRYTIVEGSPAAVRAFAEEAEVGPKVRLVNALFEEFEPEGAVDAIEMGFVLEHVDDPLLLARRYAQFLKPGGTLVVTVPNARSLHRLFGHAAGLLEDLYLLSPQDLELGHKRYFDLPQIQALLLDAGLRIVRTEGVYLKCLTTGQLKSLSLPPEIVRSFLEVGVAFPDVANALYLETTR